jgi:ABC-type multidrug transport system fused ATPase/permease subunit
LKYSSYDTFERIIQKLDIIVLSHLAAMSQKNNNNHDDDGNKKAEAVMKKRNDGESRKRRQQVQKLMLTEMKQHVLPLTIASSALLLSSSINQAIPRFIGSLMDVSVTTTTTNTVTTTSVTKQQPQGFVLQIITLSILGGLSSFVRTYIINTIQESISSTLRIKAFHSLLTKYDIEQFYSDAGQDQQQQQQEEKEKEENGSTLGTRNDGKNKCEEPDNNKSISTTTRNAMSPAAISAVLNDDVDIVSQTMTTTVANILRSASSTVFGTYNMLLINPQLVALSVGVAPVVGLVGLYTRKYIQRMTNVQQQTSVRLQEFVLERLGHIMFVKMSNRERDEIDTYNELQTRYTSLGRNVAFANGVSMGLMFAMGTSALCGILYMGRQAVLEKRMTSGQLTSFSTYSFMLALGSAGIVKGLNEYNKGIQSAVRLFRLIENDNDDNDDDARSSTTLTKNGQATAETIQQTNIMNLEDVETISFHNVSFSYQRRNSETTTTSSAKILQDVSFRLSRGEVVALVGKNGAGKSTIASLLTGLYRPNSGTVQVSTQTKQVGYEELSRTQQAQLVQVVPQNPVLFNMTILDNVRYSKPDATEDDVRRVLIDKAQCQFLTELEGGIYYNVGRDGRQLSGGQRQRIGLARTLLADPTFLVLDEPNASMDNEGELALRDTLTLCRSNRTGVLIVTHRAKTLDIADRVIVLKDGLVVEEGTLPELQKKQNGELMALMPDLE